MASNHGAIQLGFVLIIFCLITGTLANQLSSDCMKNPFATGCRGISAKRSLNLKPFVRPSGISSYDSLNDANQVQKSRIIPNKPFRYNLQEQLQILANNRAMQQTLSAYELLIESAIRLLEEQPHQQADIMDGHSRLMLPSNAEVSRQSLALGSGELASGGE